MSSALGRKRLLLLLHHNRRRKVNVFDNHFHRSCARNEAGWDTGIAVRSRGCYVTSVGGLRDSDGFSRECLSVMLCCSNSSGLCCNFYGSLGVNKRRWESLKTGNLNKREGRSAHCLQPTKNGSRLVSAFLLSAVSRSLVSRCAVTGGSSARHMSRVAP